MRTNDDTATPNWTTRSLTEIATIVRGVSYKKDEARKSPAKGYVGILRATNIGHGLDFDDLVYVPQNRVSHDQFVREHDIVIAMSSGSKALVGKAAQARPVPVTVGFGTFCAVVRPSEETFPPYLGHFFGSPAYRKLIREKSSGININNLRKDDVESMQVPLPPLPEQRRIVAKIEELFTQLDAGVQALERAKALLKQYRQSLLKSAFSGKLTEKWRQENRDTIEPASLLLERIREERKKKLGKKYKELPPLDTSNLPELPEGWAWARIGEVGEVVTGNTPPTAEKANYGGNVPFYKPSDLDKGLFVNTAEQFLTQRGLETSRPVPAGSIAVTSIGATIGKTGYLRREGVTNQQINTLIPNERLNPAFLYFQLTSSRFQAAILENASATTLPIINKGNFSALPVALPPAAEQAVIGALVEEAFVSLLTQEKDFEKASLAGQSLRQAVLFKAFAGGLCRGDT